ncbi:MAG: hypothetical protein OEQ53_11700 [Saprospiraceae bacterium]|nr:hypothetical protein [Saprospiraceae bacterium]
MKKFSGLVVGLIAAFPTIISCQVFLDDPDNLLIDPVRSDLARSLEKIGEKLVQNSKVATQTIHLLLEENDTTLTREQFSMTVGDTIVIRAKDSAGILYGVMDLAEQIAVQHKFKVAPRDITPTFAVRAIKYNLPWSAYRESQSMDYHIGTCQDLTYWKSFLDMMLHNRFNTLLLYNKHPFPFMVKSKHYPEACPFSDREMQVWKKFWTELFAMSKKRGIEVFVVNWNIIVSPSFATHHGISEYNDTSELTKDYIRTSVLQVIEEYPDLAGVGVTLADWMTGMTPGDREDWIEDTFVAAIKGASREVRFLHRAVLSGSSDEMRRILDKAAFHNPTLVEVKFNWSHGHSTPKLLITHASEQGEVNEGFWDPAPANYKIQWMIRNEDFFILRWGDPDFIRDHINMNTRNFVNGYHIGSEGYIPGWDYITNHQNAKSWTYAFERQWLYYTTWGRLLYNQETPDHIFERLFDERYANDVGKDMLHAFKLASRMPLRLATFFKSTWDYTLYSEGFMAAMLQKRYGHNDEFSPFISIDEFIDHQVLDTNYLSIKEYISMQSEGIQISESKVTPIDLCDELDHIYTEVIDIHGELLRKNVKDSKAYSQELADLKIWALLCRYFSLKIQAGISLSHGRLSNNALDRQQAVNHLEEALEIWMTLAAEGQQHYRPVPYWDSSVFGFKEPSLDYFSWQKLIPEVQRDIELARK